MLGTPRLGREDVLFEEHTRGRILEFYVPNFSGAEVYALISQVLGRSIDFSDFLTLLSCFNGAPGFYELVHDANALAPSTWNSFYKFLLDLLHFVLQKGSGLNVHSKDMSLRLMKIMT